MNVVADNSGDGDDDDDDDDIWVAIYKFRGCF